MNPFGTLRRALFGLGPKDLTPMTAHFEAGSPAVRTRLGAIVEAFVQGYHLGLEAPDAQTLGRALEEVEQERRGFAYEGAGMSAALRVMMTPGCTLLADTLRGPGDPHHYMIQIGAGWAWARFPLRHSAVQAQLDPTYHWLAWDGYGFHQTAFGYAATVTRQQGRPGRGDFADASFDHGVGRALWLVCAARPEVVAERIAAFDEARRGDLWGGVGLATTYAGGVEEPVLRQVKALAGPYAPQLGVGSALALWTRRRAGNPAPHVALASGVHTGMAPDDTIALVARLLEQVGEGDAAYPRLRAELARALGAQSAAAK